MVDEMKKLLRPKVVIPVILSVAVLAGLLFFGDIRQVIKLMEGFEHLYLLWFVILMVVYEVVRGVQWHYLLQSMGIRVPLRAQIFAYAVGEVTKSIPVGNYFQNYILQEAEGTDFARSSAATTFIILIEAFVSLMGVAIIGLADWSSWLRPLILIGLPVFGFIAWAGHAWQAHPRTPPWVKEHRFLLQALEAFRRFREGAAALFRPHIVGIAVLLGAIYVIVGASSLYLVVRGLGIGSMSLWQVWAVYFFSLAFSLIFPLPMDIGATEISGVGAFLAVGLSKLDAVGAMLVNRALSLGSAIAIALVVILILHGQFRAALQPRPSPRRSEAAKEPAEAADRA
jgi:uncharacterized membrane protein YbhN (UPF0104 family)